MDWSTQAQAIGFNTANAVIGAGVAAIDGKNNYKRQKKLMALQNSYVQEQMDKQQEINLENWNMTNEYNSPTAQRARLEAAGISPQGSAQGAAMTSASNTPAPAGSPAGPTVQPIGQHTPYVPVNYRDVALNAAQIEVLQAQAEKLHAEATNQENENSIFDVLKALRKSNLISQNLKNAIDRVELNYRGSSLATSIGEAQVRSGRDASQILANLRTAAKTEREREYLDSLERYTQAKTRHEDVMPLAVLSSAQRDMSASKHYLALAKTEDAIRQYKVDNEEKGSYLKSAQTREAYARARQTDAEIERLGKLNNLTDQEIRSMQDARKEAWARYGVDTAKDVSEEARQWVKLFVPHF